MNLERQGYFPNRVWRFGTLRSTEDGNEHRHWHHICSDDPDC